MPQPAMTPTSDGALSLYDALKKANAHREHTVIRTWITPVSTANYAKYARLLTRTDPPGHRHTGSNTGCDRRSFLRISGYDGDNRIAAISTCAIIADHT